MPEFKTEAEAIDRLRAHVQDGNGSFLLHGVANAKGANATRKADALSIGMWPSRGHDIDFFEIKCSRSDWLSELKDPAKADVFYPYVNNMYLVVPTRKIVHDDELPPGWGLIICRGDGLRKAVKATRKEAAPMPAPMLAAVIAAERRHKEDVISVSKSNSLLDDEYRRGYKNGQSTTKNGWHLVKLEKLTKVIATFEKESGLLIADGWHSTCGDLGKQVAAIQRGGVKRLQRQLPSIEHAVKLFQDGVDAIKSLEETK